MVRSNDKNRYQVFTKCLPYAKLFTVSLIFTISMKRYPIQRGRNWNPMYVSYKKEEIGIES